MSDDTEREQFKDRLDVKCYPKVTGRRATRETPTEEIKVTDPETDTEELYEVSDFAQGMARVHLRNKAVEWFADDYYKRLVGAETDQGVDDR